MDSITSLAPRAILFGLEPAVASALSASLRNASCSVSQAIGDRAAPDAGPDIVFSAGGAAFFAAKSAFPHVPVVIVSRLPDTAEWLEALELGAADYVAAPFESVQMRWILEAQVRRPQAVAATA
jgi:DNA-binding NtrC family response regulator